MRREFDSPYPHKKIEYEVFYEYFFVAGRENRTQEGVGEPMVSREGKQ